ncbi:sugar ABC transporter ATP-binding protein [Christensenellaceae bacterium OttesenSCG-928-K19]|nr:sugar ABC transporter ATP-binding protein [Christensenellaceae bacterium OttesenSCG-928-K19]
MTAQKGEVVFKAEHMKKYFGATHANDDVTIELYRGEARGLIGENGSGKSTLISMIAGIAQKDSGTMTMNGGVFEPQNSIDASRHKIGTVVQELGLVDGLPVGMNIFLGRTEQFKKGGVLNMRRLYREAEEQFSKWNFPPMPMRRMTGDLTVEEKKIVELVRALSIDPDLLILDEITQALSLNNRRILFDIIEQLKAANKAVMMVTHDVEEMVDVTDNITIMRDGEIVDTKSCDDVTADDVKRLMVGRDLKGAYYREDQQESYGDEVVLKVENLSSDHFQDVSFELHKGEILGVCGLSDAGIHELAEALFAVRDVTRGRVVYTKSNDKIQSPRQAMGLKMGYVPKDRDKQALMVNDSIEDNVALPTVELIRGKLGFLSPKKRKELAGKVIAEFEVKTSGGGQLLSSLSGGNRQKVNLGRWMIQDKEILILDCPTRGVDVGVKSYIYHRMTEAKQAGVSMVVVSDELPELIGMVDTLIIMKAGKVEQVSKRSSGFTEEAIIEVML